MSFLPQNYKIPDSKSGYFKFKDGANRFRILTPAITGYEYWNKDNKPVRQREEFKTTPLDIKLKDDGNYSQIKHFWAFLVWNYEQKMVQILEITQASIQRGLKIKIDNREGKATENDFIISRSGQGFDTEYDIDVAEASPVPNDAVMALKAKQINLEALFGGGDPFSSGTPLQSSSDASQGSSGFQKFAEAANNLPGANQPIARQNEDVAPDIQEMADQMQNDAGNPLFDEN